MPTRSGKQQDSLHSRARCVLIVAGLATVTRPLSALRCQFRPPAGRQAKNQHRHPAHLQPSSGDGPLFGTPCASGSSDSSRRDPSFAVGLVQKPPVAICGGNVSRGFAPLLTDIAADVPDNPQLTSPPAAQLANAAAVRSAAPTRSISPSSPEAPADRQIHCADRATSPCWYGNKRRSDKYPCADE